jgi:hypothetical protein
MIKDIYDNWIELCNETNKQERYVGKEKYFGASSSYSCTRKRFFKINEYEETNPTSNDAIRNMRTGTIFHDDMEKALVNAITNSNPNFVDKIKHISIEEEFVMEKLGVRGFADAIITTPDDKVYLYDFKTCTSWKYTQLFGKLKGDIIENRSISYDLQLATYGIGVLKKYGRLDKMILVFFNKEKGLMNEYEVPIKAIEMAKLYWEIQKLGTEKLPEINEISPFASWECSYCNWKDLCMKTEDMQDTNKKDWNKYIKIFEDKREKFEKEYKKMVTEWYDKYRKTYKM